MSSLRTKLYAKYRTHGIFPLLSEATKQIFSVIYSRINNCIALPLALFLAKKVTNQRGLVLFCNSHGYRGNSRYVFEWLLENGSEDISPLWLTHNLSLYLQLLIRGKRTVYLYSPRGLYYFASAKVFCYDNRGEYRFPESAERFQMRHEIPVKYGSSSQEPHRNEPVDTSTEQYGDKENTNEEKRTGPHYDYVLYPSEFLAENEKEKEVEVAPLGFPRNDRLFQVSERVANQWNEFLRGQDFDHIILYAPTSRKSKYNQKLELFPFDDFDTGRFLNFLKEINALLLIRLHPYNDTAPSVTTTRHDYRTQQDFLDALTASNHVEIAGKYQFEKTISVLPFVDILITDYSAVYHTYLQLDRPILFFPYDFDSFSKHSGFKYDYFKYLPGPTIESFSQFEEYMQGLTSGKDPHEDSRRILRERLYDYDDAESCARVASYIADLTNE